MKIESPHFNERTTAKIDKLLDWKDSCSCWSKIIKLVIMCEKLR